ncbi:MAG: LamG-like jellyroll fold domain-containing protein [Bacteroidota bacterium]
MKKVLLSVVAFLFIQNISNAQSLTDSLIAVYKMTGNANDSTSNANNGTLHGCTPTTDRFGVAGQALNFNGTSDYIDITPGNSKFKPTTFPISVSAWIRFTGSSGGGSVLMNDFTENYYYGIMFGINTATHQLSVSYLSGGALGSGSRRTKTGTTNLADGQWHLVAGVIRGATDMDLYIDCKNDGGTYSGGGGTIAYDNSHGVVSQLDIYASTDPFYYFKGDIDEIRFYHRELTANDIYRLFSNSNYPFPTVTLGNDQTICLPNAYTTNAVSNNVTTYLWDNGATTQNITISSNGNYGVTVSDNNSCKSSDNVNVTFVVCEGIQQNQNANAIELNFNSENNLVAIENLHLNVKYSFDLYNSVGQKISSENKIQSSTVYEFKIHSDLPNGFYLFTITDGIFRKTLKLIKN